MTYTFKLARRLAILRHLVVLIVLALLVACEKDLTAPESGATGSIDSPTSLQVFPRSVTIETSQGVQFRAIARTMRGQALPAAVAWMTSGGNISSDGTFSSSTAGTFKVVGRGRGRNRADTSVVVVVPPAPDLVRVEVTPGSVTLDAGATRTFTATGYLSDGSTAPIGVVWSATGGEVDPSGVYTAGLAHGSYRVIATSTSGTLADTSAITINEPAPTLVSVIVSPGSTSLTSGTSKQFKAYGRDSSGDSVAVTASFTATGGTITSTGLYTAGQNAGTYRIIASSNGKADTAAVSVAASESPPAGGSVGVPFGPFGAWATGTDLKANVAPFSLSHDATTASNILERIAAARSRGVHLSLAIVGGAHSQYLTDGVFDKSKWTARLQTFNTATIRQAVAQGVSDGTVLVGNVMDEPFHPSWGPKGTLTKAIVDGLCADMKEVFPTLPVGPTHDHRDFEPDKSYRVCDFMLSQYRYMKGDVTAFRDAGLAVAQRDGHKIAFSMNILDGGYRVEGCPVPQTGGAGTYEPNCRMTAAQVREYGRVLGPAGCIMLMWRYDDAFMANPDNAQAFRDVASLLANSPRKSCRRA